MASMTNSAKSSMCNKMSIFKIMSILAFLFILPSIESVYIEPGPRYTCPAEPNQAKLLHPCVCLQGTDSGLYVQCENSGLATLSVGLGNLASLGMPIEELTLKECNIGKLYGPMFHRLDVRIMKIIDTPIRSMDEETFFGVNRTLQNLQLINSSLSVFPKEAFRILGNLSLLRIDGHKLETLDKDIFADSLALGQLERLHIVNGELNDLFIESFQPLRKLKTLDIHGNKLTVLKKNQFKGLRDTEVLDISHNNITKIESTHIADLTKLSWCNASHNNLAELTRGMFARNAVLRVVHLDHNHIKRLDTNSFRGMRFLRRLYLSDNEISEVGRGTFSSITRIGTIDLARNKIKKIDFQMFSQLNYVEIIDVSSNQITEIQKLSFKDLYLTSINISHNMVSKIEAGAFENCANITLLDLSHNNISEILPKVFDATSYATELQLSYNFLTQLNQVPLHNMSGLKVLNVSHNTIHSIPKTTFPKLYELHTVDVSYNELTEIASAVFQPLFSLRYVNLSNNYLEQIKNPTFGTLPTVLELDLSRNMITEIAKGALTKLASCRVLDVSHNYLQKIFMMPISLGDINLAYNNISTIPENVWPTMNALLSIDLTSNPVGLGLSSESFRNLLTLRALTLTDTGLQEPPWQALSPLSSLQYLKLDGNNITALKKAAFGRLPIVFELDLSNNQISNVSEKTFDGLLQLITLSLRNNLITKIPNGAFFGLVSMRSVDLSMNQLERIDNKTKGLLDDCLSLERVNLSYNKISYLTRKTFPSDPYIPYKLYEIDLSHNLLPVIPVDLSYGTKQLKVLNISHNMINNIRKYVIGNLTSLQILDLSHNNLDDLTSEKGIFGLPVNITNINLSNNKLLDLPIGYLSNSTNLKILNVMDNMLQTIDEKLVTNFVKYGLRVYFQGNPLRCDCFSRPLKHYLNHLTQSVISSDYFAYSNLTCSSPVSLMDTDFMEIKDSQLNCNENVEIRKILDEKETLQKNSGGSQYEPEPDLAFRAVEFAREAIVAQWYVRSSSDISDFRVVIRTPNNDVFHTSDIPYNKRQELIKIEGPLKTAIEEKRPGLELCVLALKSYIATANWFDSQCKTLPEDFTKFKRKNFDVNPKNSYNRRSWFSSGSKSFVKQSTYGLYVTILIAVTAKIITERFFN